MTDHAAVPALVPPTGGRVTVSIEVSQELNISAHVARQKANRHLLLEVGDQVIAGEPEIVVGEKIWWRLPVIVAPSGRGPLGEIGYLLIDGQTGEVTVGAGQSASGLVAAAGDLYERATLSSGA